MFLLGCSGPGLVGRRFSLVGFGLSGTHAAVLVGIVAVIAVEELTRVRDVLVEFSKEVEGRKDREVAWLAAEEVGTGWLGKR